MPKRYTITTEFIIDDEAYFDYVEEQLNDFIRDNGYITSFRTTYEEIEITEREKFVTSPFYQESIINNPYFTTNTAVKLNKEFKLLQGKEITERYNENKSFGKLLDIIADKDDFYYVTEKGRISCVCGITEYKQINCGIIVSLLIFV